MIVNFYSSHMATLKDLMEIAEKHNCKISISFEANAYREVHADDLESCGIKADLAEYMEENIMMEQPLTQRDQIKFILYEKDKDKYNTMVYREYSIAFDYDEIDEDELESQTKRDKELKERLINYLDNKDEIYNGFVAESDCPTIIYGFGNRKPIKDYRVYREGMALKYFGDLVCDYLGEERINRVY